MKLRLQPAHSPVSVRASSSTTAVESLKGRIETDDAVDDLTTKQVNLAALLPLAMDDNILAVLYAV
jgi:hypothetical protein